MQTGGQHLLLDLWLDEDIRDEGMDRLFEMIRTRFTVVQEARHEFTPFGLTAVFILSESHFTVHTYPEHRYLSLDLYICNFDEDLTEFADRLRSIFRVRTMKARWLLRGTENEGRDLGPVAEA